VHPVSTFIKLPFMPQLHHFRLSPYCRKIRILAGELDETLTLTDAQPWARDPAFLALNPAATTPVLELDGETASGAGICPSSAIAEYLIETAENGQRVLGNTAEERAECRRLTAWFDERFGAEVSDLMVAEKVLKRLMRGGSPDVVSIRMARHNIRIHLNYVTFLTERRNWLAGRDFTLADMAAAAHFSVMDYLDEVPWNKHPDARDWYQRVKSRPSFRSLLADRMGGFQPPAHYDDLDF